MIPWLLIAAGGVMIYAGINKQNPLEVIKGVLTNQTGGTATKAQTTQSEPLARGKLVAK